MTHELHDQGREKQREQNRASYYRNREKRLAARAVYRSANPEKTKACVTAWREQNAERVREQNAAWKAANPEKVRADNAAWRAMNKYKTRGHWHAYRARKVANGGEVSEGLFEKLMDGQRGLCAFCLASLRLTGVHMDHIEPLAKGGAHEDQNIQLLCPTCNRRKGAKDPIAFAQANGKLL